MTAPNHKSLCPRQHRAALTVSLALALHLPGLLQAAILGPYSPDANTLHLWHLDEADAPVVDSGLNRLDLTALVNGATLNNASFTGFGSALSTYDGGPTATTAGGKDACLAALPLASGSADNVNIALADPVTAAFTFEAIVRIDFDPTLNYGTVANGGNGRNAQMMILAGEDESNPGRVFQFRIDPIGTVSGNTEVLLKWNNLNLGSTQPIGIPIPTTGPDAIAMNNWYHVAVTYNGLPGTPDNLKLYWTLLDPSRTAANLIASTNMTNNLPAASTDFSIGNTARSTPNVNFVGLIDEVRISSIERSPNDMVFGAPLRLQSALLGANQLVLTASGGVAGGTGYVLESTDVALPLNSWTPIATNVFDSRGNFTVTNQIAPGTPQRFFILQLP